MLVATTGVGGAPSQTITLQAGDCAELKYAFSSLQGFNLIVSVGGTTALIPTTRTLEPVPERVVNPVKLSGPCSFYCSAGTNGVALATFSITRANAIPTVTPANAVVIPNDANGNYQVILESSTDMITWTAANPGTYSGSTQKRFFRTRVVKQ